MAVPLDTEELSEPKLNLSPSISRTSDAVTDAMHGNIISRHAPTASFGQLSLSSTADGSEHFIFSALPVEEQSPVKEFKDDNIRAMLEAATRSDARSVKRPRGTRHFAGRESPKSDSSSKLRRPHAPKSSPPSPEHGIGFLHAPPSGAPSVESVHRASPTPLQGRLSDTSASLYEFERKRRNRQSVTLPGIGALELSSDSESDYDDEGTYHEEEEASGSLLGNPNSDRPAGALSTAASRRSKRRSAARRHEKETRAIQRELSLGSAGRERRLKLKAALEMPRVVREGEADGVKMNEIPSCDCDCCDCEHD